jgi:hypothetical protein
MRKVTPFRFKLVGIVIGIVATLMALFPALTYEGATYTGVQVAYGHEFFNLGIFGSGQIEFSVLNIVAYLLPIVGSIFLIYSKKGYLISAIIFGAASVMLFFVRDFTIVTFTVGNIANEFTINWTYGIGLIVAGILSTLGALNGIFGIFVKENHK